MSVWSTRRQLAFVAFFVVLLALGVAGLLYFNQEVPTCTDGLTNQSELGVDCGGPCIRICPVETNELVILWTRIFKVREGVYDVAALVENPNPFGVVSADYKIRVYDADNLPVKDIEGSTYLNPHERFLVFEPNVDVGFRTPTRAFLTFDNDLDWRRLGPARKPDLRVGSYVITNTPILSLKSSVNNMSIFNVENVEVVAILSDGQANATHVSRTFIDSLNEDATKEIVFTWPNVKDDKVVGVLILPRVDLVTANLLAR